MTKPKSSPRIARLALYAHAADESRHAQHIHEVGKMDPKWEGPAQMLSNRAQCMYASMHSRMHSIMLVSSRPGSSCSRHAGPSMQHDMLACRNDSKGSRRKSLFRSKLGDIGAQMRPKASQLGGIQVRFARNRLNMYSSKPSLPGIGPNEPIQVNIKPNDVEAAQIGRNRAKSCRFRAMAPTGATGASVGRCRANLARVPPNSACILRS